jgi:SAM-dependent methyltransferase
MSDPSSSAARCWCGNADLVAFSPGYLRCAACGTLLVARLPADTVTVADEGSSLYGLNYFYDHARELGHPSMTERAHLDLPERCVYWLRALLRRRPPPARVLELGCASGAFVGLLTAAGYEATGLDLSPAVTAFARETFEVETVTGPLEDQPGEPGRFDAIVLMDVIEHLPDPAHTLRAAARALADDGLLLVQTPRFDPRRSLEELRAARDPFLEHLKPDEHLVLFSPASLARLLAETGFPEVAFERAIFAHYDMFCVAGKRPVPQVEEGRWRAALRRSRSARIVEALVEADLRAWSREAHLQDIERDRAARLEVILRQGAELGDLRGRLASLEAHHAAAVAALETRHRAAMAALEARHAGAMAAQEARHAGAEAALSERHAEAMEALETRAAATVSAREAELSALLRALGPFATLVRRRASAT